MSLHLWFTADNAPWKVVSHTTNKNGVFKCVHLITGRTGYFTADVVSRATITIA